ncbi:MAG TPA: glutathione S-transferase family protein [Vitreimonas sp.]|uniref:glutathione S-transferase family protein n=1 Tax=Vitreimonas sp. TaxID=3069702 RepID=UPI002D46611F|nr:glutathione S-transferase family protein [Vitreimonas sp.]HYD89383.1 glutathione S-transferase family protein [Vitreimonas sp.]
MKLHVFPHSPRAFKVLAVAHHLGLDYEFCFCDLTKGATRAPEFAALNPNQKMPVLEEGAFKLWESNAIIQYLAEKNPEAGLIPADAKARADMAQWMFWESTTWDRACAILAFERGVKRVLGLGEPDAAEVERGLSAFHAAASILDAHLKGRRFVSGDRLTLADFAVAADLILEPFVQLPLEPYAEIRRWGAAMAQLPGWQAALALQNGRLASAEAAA